MMSYSCCVITNQALRLVVFMFVKRVSRSPGWLGGVHLLLRVQGDEVGMSLREEEVSFGSVILAGRQTERAH